jgi:NarL family two-component system response regulator LiaR
MTETKPIRVLVVEDHIVVREGLCALIAIRPDLEVAGVASDGFEAVTEARASEPDVILMDLVLPGKDGISAIREIIAENPDTRILVLTSFSEDKRVYQAVEAGALGYLLKDSSSEDLIRAILEVHRGELSLQPDIALKIARELNQPSSPPRVEDPLTTREVEVLKLLAHGLPNQKIAAELGISARTVTTHVSNILGKLHLTNRTEAALYAVQEGLADG